VSLRIAGGAVYDPANGVAGETRDVCLDGGSVVAELPDSAPRIDARGMVVMPGGVDIHAHIAGPKVNLARKLQPGDPIVPPAPETGERYALPG
jgi:formylmethanofuran dehydrogenase subunit A